MSRSRSAFYAACLALVLLAGLPGAAVATGSTVTASLAWGDSSFAQPAPAGDRLVRAAADWGKGALTWMQSIFAGEHGAIVPIFPEPPPDPCTLPDPPATCPPDPELSPEP